jgi:hypothetical protein
MHGVSLRWQCIVIDCREAARVARFWSQALGVPAQGPHEWGWPIEPGAGSPDAYGGRAGAAASPRTWRSRACSSAATRIGLVRYSRAPASRKRSI